MILILFIFQLVIYTGTTISETLLPPYLHHVEDFEEKTDPTVVQLSNVFTEGIRHTQIHEDEEQSTKLSQETKTGVEETLQADEDNNNPQPQTLNTEVREPEPFPDPPPQENIAENEETTDQSRPQNFNPFIANSSSVLSSTEFIEHTSTMATATEENNSKISNNKHMSKDPHPFEENTGNQDNGQTPSRTSSIAPISDPPPFPDLPPESYIDELGNSSDHNVPNLSKTLITSEPTVNPDSTQKVTEPVRNGIGQNKIGDKNVEINFTGTAELMKPAITQPELVQAVPEKKNVKKQASILLSIIRKPKDPDPFEENIENTDKANSERTTSNPPIIDPPPFPDSPTEIDIDELEESPNPPVTINQSLPTAEASVSAVPDFKQSLTKQAPTNISSSTIKFIRNPEIGKVPPGIEDPPNDSTKFEKPETTTQTLLKSLSKNTPSEVMEITIGKTGIFEPIFKDPVPPVTMKTVPSKGDIGNLQESVEQNTAPSPINTTVAVQNFLPPSLWQQIQPGKAGSGIGSGIDQFNPGHISSSHSLFQKHGVAGEFNSGLFGVDNYGNGKTQGQINPPVMKPVDMVSNTGPHSALTPNGGHSSGNLRPEGMHYGGWQGHRKWQHGHRWHGHRIRPNQDHGTNGGPIFDKPNIGILIIGNPQFGCSNPGCLTQGAYSTSDSNGDKTAAIVNWLYSVLRNRPSEVQMPSS